jgi:hypothetical protein
MKSSKQVSWISLMLCVAALALPACGGANGGIDSTGTSAALTNNVDDDKDGRVDEGDEGSDDDQDGKVDEAAEHEDACAEHGHHGRRLTSDEAREAHGDDAADDADGADESADEAGDEDKAAGEAGDEDEAAGEAGDEDEAAGEAGDEDGSAETDESADDVSETGMHRADMPKLDCSDIIEDADDSVSDEDSAEDSSAEGSSGADDSN